MSKITIVHTLLLFSFYLISCAHKDFQMKFYSEEENFMSVNTNIPLHTQIPKNKEKNNDNVKIVYEKLLKGNKIFSQKKRKARGSISLHFDDINLENLLKVLSKDVLGFSYVSAVPLTQRVSINVKDISREDLLKILKDILSSFNYVVVIDKGNKLIKILPSSKINYYNSQVYVYSPTYVSALDIAKLLKEIVDKSTVKIFSKGDILVAVGPSFDVQIIIDIIKKLDIPIYSGKYISFIKTNYSAKNIKSSLEKIFKLLKIENKGIVDYLSDNLLIVITKDEKFLNFIKEWIYTLESATEYSEKKVYVLKLNYLNAEDIADLLNNLNIEEFSIISLDNKSNPKTKEKIMPSFVASSSSKKKKQTDLKDKSKLDTYSSNFKSKKGISIIAHKPTNSLIIQATPLQFEMIKSLVKQLDKIPKQVFIEMAVVEVSLGKSLNFGIEGLFKGFIDSYQFSIENSLGLRGNAGGLLGLKAIVFGKNADIRGILNFLASKTKLKVLSAPYILVKNNEEAKIEIGAEVPVITEQMTSTSGGVPVVTTAVQYRSTGIILTVKPIISDNGYITLHIKEEVSDALPNTISPGVQSPIITKRAADTVLILKSGQVALLGGIIQQRQENNERGVPYISDIPGLGYLFKRKDNTSSKTELVVLIKVNILNEPRNIESINARMIHKLEEVRKLIKLIKKQNQKNEEKS